MMKFSTLCVALAIVASTSAFNNDDLKNKIREIASKLPCVSECDAHRPNTENTAEAFLATINAEKPCLIKCPDNERFAAGLLSGTVLGVYRCNEATPLSESDYDVVKINAALGAFESSVAAGCPKLDGIASKIAAVIPKCSAQLDSSVKELSNSLLCSA